MSAYEAITKFYNDLENKLSNHADEFVEKVNESNILSQTQEMNLKTSKLQITYFLKNCLLPEVEANQMNLFKLLIGFMKTSTDSHLQSLAEKLVEERAFSTSDSQEATEFPINGMYLYVHIMCTLCLYVF